MLLVPMVGWAAAADGVGGNDAYTRLLLHCDGADASTTFTDSSASGHAVTANADAQIDTAQSVFGGASGLFDGSGDYLSVPDSDDWNFGNGDFTIDFRARWAATANYQNIIGQWGDSGANGSWHLILFGAGRTLRFLYSTDGASEVVDADSGWSPSLDTWYHIAAVRNGADLKLFVDGVQQGSTYNIGAAALYNSTRALDIGAYKGGGAPTFNGWLDEIRISKGIARWTANFTPPTSAYS